MSNGRCEAEGQPLKKRRRKQKNTPSLWTRTHDDAQSHSKGGQLLGYEIHYRMSFRHYLFVNVDRRQTRHPAQKKPTTTNQKKTKAEIQLFATVDLANKTVDNRSDELNK